MSSTPGKKTTRSNSTSGLTLSDIKTLIENMRKDILDTMKKENAKINKNIEELSTRLCRLEKANAELRLENEKLKEDVKELMTTKDDNFASIVDELHLRSIRNLNLIYFGIHEKSDGSLEERRVYDKEFCDNLLSKLGINETVDQPVRIGRPKNNAPRLLRIKCTSQEEKLRILRSSKTLRDLPEYKNVYIHPDRTPMQQAAHKALREELRRRKLEGEDVMIFKGKIVEKMDQQNFQERF
jgi:regulator of replication initiation timing